MTFLVLLHLVLHANTHEGSTNLSNEHVNCFAELIKSQFRIEILLVVDCV